MEDRKDKGLFLRNGEEWKRVKRFMMRTMKDLGLSKPSLQLTIQVNILYNIIYIYIILELVYTILLRYKQPVWLSW